MGRMLAQLPKRTLWPSGYQHCFLHFWFAGSKAYLRKSGSSSFKRSFGPRCGADPTEGASRGGWFSVPNVAIGELLLRAGELLYEHHVKPGDDLDQLANLISQFLPIYEIDSPTEAFIQFLRFYIMLTVNIPRLPAESKTFDVEAAFEKQFGFSLKTYCDSCFSSQCTP